MRAIEVVLEHQLPVAVVRVLEDAARHLELAARRAVDEIVERGLRGAEEVFQRGPLGARDAKMKPRYVATRGAARAELLQPLRRIAGREWHRLEFPAAVVAPAVIRAHEAFGVAPSFGAHHRAAMGAAIDEHMDPVLVPHDDHRFLAHARGEVVAGLRHLALVTQHQPRASEDALHLELEDRRIGIHRAMHAVRLH